MVIKGRSRGNGKQLGQYLIDKGRLVNEAVHVVEVRGSTSQNPKYAILEMSLAAELTRGDLGLYHAQINPAYEEDRPMTPDDWILSADTLEKELKLDGQKRVIVLHEKKGRIHAHVVWQREKDGKLISDSQSFRAHDRARETLEKAFNHERTPQTLERNARQRTDKRKEQNKDRKGRTDPELKATITKEWQASKDGKEFIDRMKGLGIDVTRGDKKRPYMAFLPDGQKVDLVRQITTAKTREVKERLDPVSEYLPREADFRRERETPRPEPERIPDDSERFSQTINNFREAQTKSRTQERAANDNRKQKVEEFAQTRDEIEDPEIRKFRESLERVEARRKQEKDRQSDKVQEFKDSFQWTGDKEADRVRYAFGLKNVRQNDRGRDRDLDD